MPSTVRGRYFYWYMAKDITAGSYKALFAAAVIETGCMAHGLECELWDSRTTRSLAQQHCDQILFHGIRHCIDIEKLTNPTAAGFVLSRLLFRTFAEIILRLAKSMKKILCLEFFISLKIPH